MSSRDEGVAPLAVYFNALWGVSWDEVERTRFVWDFGDGGTGEGYLAAHVYELADDEPEARYTVTLTLVRDGQTVGTAKRGVTVRPFAGRTVVVSTMGDFAGAPAGAEEFSTLAAAWDTVRSPHTRVLLRRGETFASGPLAFNTDGPVILGAFGDEADPRPRIDASGDPFAGVTRPDHRFVDLDVSGDTTTTPVEFSSDHVLVLRSKFGGMRRGFISSSAQKGYTFSKFRFIVDSEMTAAGNPGKTSGTFLAGSHTAILNSRFEHDLQSAHTIRVNGHHYFLLSGSHLTARNSHDCLTMRAGSADGRPESRYLLVKGNELHLNGGFTLANNLWSGSDVPDEHIQYTIVERNRFSWDEPNVTRDEAGVIIASSDYVFRNNLFVGTAPSGAVRTAISIRQVTWPTGTLNSPDRIKIYNNTFFDLSSHLVFLWLETPQVGIDVRNNLMAAPNAISQMGASPPISWAAASIMSDPSAVSIERNLWYLPKTDGTIARDEGTKQGYDLATWRAMFGRDDESLTTDPLFVSVDPTNADFLLPGPTSPAVDAGEVLSPVFDDFGGRLREGRSDLGARARSP